jgi:poly-gamma-glutamate synthesis protein (capsule biosynthesis protein)
MKYRRLAGPVMLLLLSFGCATPSTDASLASTVVIPFAPECAATSPQPSPTPTVPADTPAPSSSTSTVPWHTPTADPLPVSLAFVGDMMLDRTIRQRITSGHGEEVFASVWSVLQQADIAVGNLESAIGTSGERAQKGYTFLAPPEAADYLEEAGFDLLTLSNNHVMDYGIPAFQETLALVDDHHLLHVGAGMDEAGAHAPARIDIRGTRIAFLAFADIPVEYGGFDAREWIARESLPGITWADPDTMQADIEPLRADADFIVVLMHFGVEGEDHPSSNQMMLARAAIDFGADLVVGSHPHVLQESETYKDGLILYSLGNFVFDGFSGKANESAIAWVGLRSGGRITLQFIPVNIQDGLPILLAAP